MNLIFTSISCCKPRFSIDSVRTPAILVAVLTLFVSGCSEAEPPVAGGKPVDHWLESVADKDPKVRVKAIEKLGNIGPKSPAAIDAIVEALSDEDPAVRKVAVFAVVRNPSTWIAAAPRLEEMMESDPVEEVRKVAEEAHSNLSK